MAYTFHKYLKNYTYTTLYTAHLYNTRNVIGLHCIVTCNTCYFFHYLAIIIAYIVVFIHDMAILLHKKTFFYVLLKPITLKKMNTSLICNVLPTKLLFNLKDFQSIQGKETW